MEAGKTDIDFSAVIADLNGFDDEFFNALMQGNVEGVQQLLRIVLRIPDLVILKNPQTQQYLKNIYGRSIRMDCYSESLRARFNVEIQRDSRGAPAKRARFHSSLLDAGISHAGDDFSDLPDTYVIFITEHDIYKAGKPYYEIERVVKTLGIDFKDGEHILYVNGAYKGNDPIGWLMQDLHCTNPHEMHEGPLKERALFLKETKEGVKMLSEKMQEIQDIGYEKGIKVGEARGLTKGLEQANRNFALKMIANGDDNDQIAHMTDLTNQEIDELRSSTEQMI